MDCKASPLLGRDVFVYVPRDGTFWLVLRGTVGGKCAEVDKGMRTIVMSEAEESAKRYCSKWGDTYKGVVDGNELERDTTEIVSMGI